MAGPGGFAYGWSVHGMLTTLVALATFTAPAANAADVALGANTVAMGSAAAADPYDNAALTLNPGLLALTERYDFQAQFGFGPTGGLHWAFSGMDGRTSDKIAGGFVYSGDAYSPPLTTSDLPGWVEVGAEIPNKHRDHEVAIGVAAPVLDHRLSFGLAGNLQFYDHDLQGKGVGFDLDVGVGVRPIEPLTFGLALRNPLPFFGADRATSVVGGVRGELVENFAIEADATWLSRVADSEALPLVIGGGVEKAIGQARIRLGGARAVDGLASLTAGLGWEREGAAFEYGLVVPLRDVRFATTVHALQLRFSAPADIEPPEEP